MKYERKKYIHRKVTNQSDFLIQLPHVTGVLVRTQKETKGWMAENPMLIRQTCLECS